MDRVRRSATRGRALDASVAFRVPPSSMCNYQIMHDGARQKKLCVVHCTMYDYRLVPTIQYRKYREVMNRCSSIIGFFFVGMSTSPPPTALPAPALKDRTATSPEDESAVKEGAIMEMPTDAILQRPCTPPSLRTVLLPVEQQLVSSPEAQLPAVENFASPTNADTDNCTDIASSEQVLELSIQFNEAQRAIVPPWETASWFKLFRHVDEDRSGLISYSEFVRMVRRHDLDHMPRVCTLRPLRSACMHCTWCRFARS